MSFLKKIFIVCLLLSIPALCRGAVFLEGSSARPVGLGNAYVAQADDGAALFANPAGLASIKNLKLISMYTQAAGDITFTTFGAAFPTPYSWTIGLGWRNRTQSNVPVSSEVVNAVDNDILVSAARPLTNQFSFGFDLRFLTTGFSRDVPGYENFNGSGNAADLGIKFVPRTWLGLGMSVKNLGGKITYRDGVVKEAPVNLILGSSFKIGEKQETRLNLDLGKRADEPVLLHLGIEWKPIDILFLRLGLDQTPNGPSASYNNLTLGVGLQYSGFTFDYALYSPQDTLQDKRYYFSLGYVGREEKVKPAPPPLPTREVTVIKRKHFSDVPGGYWARDPIEILASIGIISGYPDGTFRPEKTITKAELSKLLGMGASENKAVSRVEGVIMIARFAGLSAEAVTEAVYPDLPGRNWAAPLILAAKREGLLKFIGEQFEPKKNLTRAETAEILNQTQFIKKKLLDFSIM